MLRLCPVLFVLGGCSFIGLRAPSPPVPADVDCGSALPYVDLAVGIAGISTLPIVGAMPCENGQGTCYNPWTYLVGLPAAGVGIIALSSALYVASRKVACENRREKARAQLVAQQRIVEEGRRRLVTLTDEAARSAEAGTCMRVLEMEVEVAALPASVPRETFTQNPSVATCLTQAARDKAASESITCAAEHEERFLATNAVAAPHERLSSLQQLPTCLVTVRSSDQLRRRASARALGTRAAVVALETKNCDAVRTLAAEARAIDPAYFEGVVARHVDVASCLLTPAAETAARREACREERAKLMRAAAAMTDAGQRTAELQRLPRCD